MSLQVFYSKNNIEDIFAKFLLNVFSNNYIIFLYFYDLDNDSEFSL